MLIPKLRFGTSIEPPPSLLIEGRIEVPSKKRGFRGVYNAFQKTKLIRLYIIHLLFHTQAQPSHSAGLQRVDNNPPDSLYLIIP